MKDFLESMYYIMQKLCSTDIQRDIHQRANDELADAGLESLYLRFVCGVIKFIF